MFSRITAFFNRIVSAHLAWIHGVTTRRPGAIIACSLLLAIAAIFSISSIRFETDIFRLFPTHQPALKLLLESLEWSGGGREAYFLLEGERTSLPAEAELLAGRLRALRLDGQPAFGKVTWRVFDESEARSFSDFVAYAVTRPQLFIAPGDAAKYAARFGPATMDGAMERLKADLAGQFGGAMTGLAAADPLFLRDLVLPRLKAASQALDLAPDSPYFLSRDGRVLIMIAEPARPVGDMAFARRLVAGINEARKGLGVNVSCAGAHISAVLDEAAMKSNIVACILSSLAMVLAIFYAVYRRILPTLLLPLIIAVGVALALGVAGLLLPSIHIISFAFMALIIGLGTDYSIHLYDRFHTERAAGTGSDEALRLAIVDTGHGLFTAATTTAVPFLALMVSDVRALSELGLLVGLGVIFSLYATFFFLPPLLIFMEQRFPAQYRPIPALGLGPVWRLAGSFPRTVVLISVLAAIAMTAASTRTFFDGELKNLQPRHSEAFLAQEKIERHLSLAPRQLLVAVEGQELAEVLLRLARVDALAERWRQGRGVVAWSSLGMVLNNRDEQRQVAERIEKSREATSMEGLAAALVRHGFEPAPFRGFMDAVQAPRALEPVAEAEAIARLRNSPLRGVVDRHLVRDASGYHALQYLYYNDRGFDTAAFLRDLKRVDPTARATGVDLVSGQLAASVRQSFLRGFAIGGLLVLFLLIAHFQTLSGVFYALFPVAAGAACMLGIMALIGMGLNFMNAMVLVTIVGMGSDYGLHIRHRVADGRTGNGEERFVQAGRAVFLSALTTIAGFGSLAFADYPALASIGWATNLGVGFTALFALVTIPAVIRLWRKSDLP